MNFAEHIAGFSDHVSNNNKLVFGYTFLEDSSLLVLGLLGRYVTEKNARYTWNTYLSLDNMEKRIGETDINGAARSLICLGGIWTRDVEITSCDCDLKAEVQLFRSTRQKKVYQK